MPKRYEEEINEILHKFDDWPPQNERGQRPRFEPPPHGNDPLTAFGQFFEHIGPQQLMAVGLLLIFVGVALRFAYRVGVDVGISGYATVLGVLLLLAGYILAVVRGGSGGIGGVKGGQHMWRGQVVDLRPSNGGL
ncbi:MAG TPA: hypothetical protein VKU60_09485, partial [Chloroflexota bacterium]|nr:hypothetical protein [Chloroflexota bacterium]